MKVTLILFRSEFAATFKLAYKGRRWLAFIRDQAVTANLGLLTIFKLIVDVAIMLDIIHWVELFYSCRCILEGATITSK